MRLPPDFKGGRRALAAVIGLYVLVASAYSVILPLGEAPDEVSHYSYARHIALEGRLPLTEGAASGEAFQPPLYYAVGAAISGWIPEGRFTVKGNSDYSLAVVDSVPNVLLHTGQEAFPYRDGALAWHLIRLMSVGMGAVTVWATYALAMTVFPGRHGLAIATAAFIAFLPEFLFISSSVNNDNLATMLSSLTLLQMARLWRTERKGDAVGHLTVPAAGAPESRRAGAVGGAAWLYLGLLLGLGFWTKVSLLVFWPLAGLVALHTVVGPRTLWGDLLRNVLIIGPLTFVSAALICLPLAVRNTAAYGDPLGWSLMRQVTDAVSGPLTPGDYANWLLQLFQSFWGRFGGAAHVLMHPLVYAGLALVSAMALCGIVRFLWRCRKADANVTDYSDVSNGHGSVSDSGPRFSVGLLALLGLHCLLVAVLLWQWAHTNQGTGQARLAYPALSAIGLFFVIGLAETGACVALWATSHASKLAPCRSRELARLGARPGLPQFVAGGLFLLSVVTLAGYLLPLYHLPPRVALGDVPASALRGPFIFGSNIRLLGWTVDDDVLAPGGLTYVTLYWQVDAAPREDYWLLLRLQGEGDRSVWAKDGSPSAGRDSTDTWRAGDTIAARHRITLSDQTPPGRYRLLAGLHRFGAWDWLMISDVPGKILGDTIALEDFTVASK
jgi:hypothetical protein